MKNNNLLKTYTILLPIYREELMLDQLIQAIENLNYPKYLLQILFLLEKDDNKTLQTLLTIKISQLFFNFNSKRRWSKNKSKCL
jgi:cellulose synthase/poly-beta-1,6-N-acetylglucosamine synthase-like glycosyltransferase